MSGIEYTASFGFQKRKVVLTQPSGASGAWYVYVDNYFWGQLYFSETFGWSHGLRSTEISGGDVLAIIEVIEGYDALK